MNESVSELDADGTLFGRLRAASSEAWQDYCEHEFVCRIGDGSLPVECFRHYLRQDYVFLIHFARAWALAAYKAESLEDIRAASATLNAIVNHEMSLHVEFCARWGIAPHDMTGTTEEPANLAYTRYVLERGMAGDVLDLHVALAPCVVGYAEIGRRLLLKHAGDIASNPYAEWIRMYAGDDYQAVAAGAIEQLERLGNGRGAAARFHRLAQTFHTATRLEIDFWNMGLAPCPESNLHLSAS